MWMDRNDQKEFAQVNGADPVLEVPRAQADVGRRREPIDHTFNARRICSRSAMPSRSLRLPTLREVPGSMKNA